MSNNNVIPFSPAEGAMIAPEALSSSINAGIVESGRGSTTDPILRLLRDGTWVYGADAVDVEVQTEWAFNPFSLQHGYICWDGDANLLGEVMMPLSAPRPAWTDLPKHEGADWSEQFQCIAVCVSGEDAGQQVVYKPSSVGGRRAMSNLMQAIQGQLQKEGPEGAIVPVVTLGASDYNHKKYGKIYNPILKIARWAVVGEGPAEEPVAAEAPAVAEAPAEEPAPRRRRRRNA